MNKEELELIEKCAALILSGYIANPNYSSKYQNEYISEAIDYAVELHNQIKIKSVHIERVRLGTSKLKSSILQTPPCRFQYLRCPVCGLIHYDGINECAV